MSVTTVAPPVRREPKTRIFIGESLEQISKFHELVGGPTPVAYEEFRELHGYTGPSREWITKMLEYVSSRPLESIYFIMPALEPTSVVGRPKIFQHLPNAPEALAFLVDQLWMVDPNTRVLRNWRASNLSDTANFRVL